MSWRSNLEDKHTVTCIKCGHESVDPGKTGNQKYIQGKCLVCGHVHNKKD